MAVMTKKKIIQIYKSMLLIRRFEEEIVRLYPEQEMKTPTHLYIGQEAIASAVCANLNKNDYVFGTHRSHGIYIAKGGNLKRLAAELYCKRTGCSAGKGGSMHVIDTACGVCGTTAIVGGNIPLAVGAAMTIAFKGTSQVSCSFFGDGAVDEGVFFESISFAVLKKLPVIFICENNFFATQSHQSNRQPFDNICDRGYCFGMPKTQIDGNDIFAVNEAADRAVISARNGNGPSLIECRTYRWKSHVGPKSDLELGTAPGKFLKQWMKKCPIERLEKYFDQENIISESERKKISDAIDKEIKSAFSYAKKSPLPKPKDLFSDVISKL